MKTIRNILLATISGILLFSCESKTMDMLTVINPNGSCYKMISKKVDVNIMIGNTKDYGFVVETDSTWKYSWKYNENDDEIHTNFPLTLAQYDSVIMAHKAEKNNENVFTLFARKDFKSVNEMAAYFKYRSIKDFKAYTPTYELQKKFRWFYTYYDYKETYPKLKIEFAVPIEKYLTKDESEFWFKGIPNLTMEMNGMEMREYVGDLENKYNLWLMDNIRTLTFNKIIDNYDKIKNPPVVKERLMELQDSIIPLNKLSLENWDEKLVQEHLKNYFKTNAFATLWQGKDSTMQKLNDTIQNTILPALYSKKIGYQLVMPGKLLSSTSLSAKKDTLNWTLETHKMITSDYVLEAKSRKLNVWAWIITGLILIIAMGSFIYKPKK